MFKRFFESMTTQTGSKSRDMLLKIGGSCDRASIGYIISKNETLFTLAATADSFLNLIKDPDLPTQELNKLNLGIEKISEEIRNIEKILGNSERISEACRFLNLPTSPINSYITRDGKLSCPSETYIIHLATIASDNERKYWEDPVVLAAQSIFIPCTPPSYKKLVEQYDQNLVNETINITIKGISIANNKQINEIPDYTTLMAEAQRIVAQRNCRRNIIHKKD